MDMAMCRNNICTLRSNCYRHISQHTHLINERQSFSSFAQDENGLCKYFIPIKEVT